MKRNPSMRMALWISQRMEETNADDVYDVLLGSITSPNWFVEEVVSLSEEYEEDLRRNNIRLK